MKTPNSCLFFTYYPLLIIVIISWVKSVHSHDHQDDIINCLQSLTNNITQYTNVINTPNNTTYVSILQSYNSFVPRKSNESILKPSVIVTPSHETHIQATIYCAKKHGLQIRVRSGGHDYEGLSYMSETPFVIIDLKNLRSIKIDMNEKTAWIEAGATLGEVYHAISQKSKTLAFPAGSCPTVGVGGLFSGGGYGMMSRKFGLSADNIVDARIIDANGLILDRKIMGEDLFWAIRGGGAGPSFGIILAWKVNLLTVPENVTVFNVTKTLDQNATQLVHRWQFVADKIDENLTIRLFITSEFSRLTGKRKIVVSFTSMFIGGTKDLLEIMQKSFPELGLVKEDCIEMSWIESILFFAFFPLNSPIDVLLKRTWLDGSILLKGKSDYVMSPISEKDLTKIWEHLYEEDGAQLQFSPFGGKMAETSESETPFPHRAGNIFMIHYSVGWSEEENSEASMHISWIRRLYTFMASYVSKSPRRAYMNYRDLDLGINDFDGDHKSTVNQAKKWGLPYFGVNFNRLVLVKTKVDPTNFFRNEQSIPPL